MRGERFGYRSSKVTNEVPRLIQLQVDNNIFDL